MKQHFVACFFFIIRKVWFHKICNSLAWKLFLPTPAGFHIVLSVEKILSTTIIILLVDISSCENKFQQRYWISFQEYFFHGNKKEIKDWLLWNSGEWIMVQVSVTVLLVNIIPILYTTILMFIQTCFFNISNYLFSSVLLPWWSFMYQ